MTNKQIKKKLELIKLHVNELALKLREQYGSGSYIYFEAEGGIHAMLDCDDMHCTSATERQKKIIESAHGCMFDCGAW